MADLDTQGFIRDGIINDLISAGKASLHINETQEFGKDSTKTNFEVTLKNAKGIAVYGSTSTVSLDRALSQLQRKVEVGESERLNAKTPFKVLEANINHLTKYDFYNTNADPLSNRATFNGWDIARYTPNPGEWYAEVRIHNAANSVLSFELLQDSSCVKLNLVNTRLHRFEYFERLTDMLGFVHNYLDTPLADRKAEVDSWER